MTDQKPGNVDAGLTDADYSAGFVIFKRGFDAGYLLNDRETNESIRSELAKLSKPHAALIRHVLESAHLGWLLSDPLSDCDDDEAFYEWCRYIQSQSEK